ncbi:uncharacterized protein [Branchiostoma lanceolatum]|uniref:uncharacterized protein n=1 Tax=Branchiostoma lanceolatum TaxID=7740 RepID=UPI0034569A50
MTTETTTYSTADHTTSSIIQSSLTITATEDPFKSSNTITSSTVSKSSSSTTANTASPTITLTTFASVAPHQNAKPTGTPALRYDATSSSPNTSRRTRAWPPSFLSASNTIPTTFSQTISISPKIQVTQSPLTIAAPEASDNVTSSSLQTISSLTKAPTAQSAPKSPTISGTTANTASPTSTLTKASASVAPHQNAKPTGTPALRYGATSSSPNTSRRTRTWPPSLSATAKASNTITSSSSQIISISSNVPVTQSSLTITATEDPFKSSNTITSSTVSDSSSSTTANTASPTNTLTTSASIAPHQNAKPTGAPAFRYHTTSSSLNTRWRPGGKGHHEFQFPPVPVDAIAPTVVLAVTALAVIVIICRKKSKKIESGDWESGGAQRHRGMLQW